MGDGVTDDREAIENAFSAASGATGEKIVFFPPGTYKMSQNSSLSYSIDVGVSNITIAGVRGQSWIKHPSGMPDTSVSIFRLNDLTNVTIRDLGFDGNWGNSENGTDANTGINHTTQRDPKNHLVMIRGCENITIENCQFRQAYGDLIWIGASATTFTSGSRNVKISNIVGDMSARNGITLGQKCESIHIDRARLTNIYISAVDTEPVDQYVRDVTVERSYLGGWWNPANSNRAVNVVLSIAGGKDLCPGEQTNARQFRVSDCTIAGAVLVQAATDVAITRNRIICDWAGSTFVKIVVACARRRGL